ncbi:MAG: amidohydrolase family protein [Opitutales bacterium]
MKIDAHNHFWRYNAEEYDWIDDEMSAIRRDFLPADLQEELRGSGIQGTVSVQARMNLEETEWLLELSQNNKFIKGIVGWLPIADTSFPDYLDRYASNTKLKGIRHVVQGQPKGFLGNPAFNQGIRKLTDRDLVYDILIFENQLQETIQFVDRHPNQRFVLDHIAKPRIRDNAISPWDKNIQELAARENVSCKLSGMVTEADYHSWNEDQLHPYIDICLEAFGANRLMFGSDWPVCLVATPYPKWVNLIETYISPLTQKEQSRIMGGTAIEVYKQ